jgi:hypothetical protein
MAHQMPLAGAVHHITVMPSGADFWRWHVRSSGNTPRALASIS